MVRLGPLARFSPRTEMDLTYTPMPTPNQTTPDSPERVRGENVRSRCQLLASHILMAGSSAQRALAGVEQAHADVANFSKQIEDLVAAETTRLAEALKEAREKLEAVTAWAESIEVVHAHPFLNNRCIVEARQFLAAPISGAKKE